MLTNVISFRSSWWRPKRQEAREFKSEADATSGDNHSRKSRNEMASVLRGSNLVREKHGQQVSIGMEYRNSAPLAHSRLSLNNVGVRGDSAPVIDQMVTLHALPAVVLCCCAHVLMC